MPRNTKGQFEPGTCGNPRGRPCKTRRKITEEQLREIFFEAGETMVPIIENGRRKLIPASLAIEKQLAVKAASGNLRAIIEWNKRNERHTSEHDKRRLELLDCLIKSEDSIRKYPEDVTDEYKALTAQLRAILEPDLFD